MVGSAGPAALERGRSGLDRFPSEEEISGVDARTPRGFFVSVRDVGLGDVGTKGK